MAEHVAHPVFDVARVGLWALREQPTELDWTIERLQTLVELIGRRGVDGFTSIGRAVLAHRIETLEGETRRVDDRAVAALPARAGARRRLDSLAIGHALAQRLEDGRVRIWRRQLAAQNSLIDEHAAPDGVRVIHHGERREEPRQ